MAELDLSVVISRDLLGLTPLELNDGIVFKVGVQFLGGTVQWNRNQVGGAHVDGQVTIDRTRQMVQETITVEVWGRLASDMSLSAKQLQKNMDRLVAAFTQDSFTLTVSVDDAQYVYSGESSDYALAWTGVRWIAREGLVTLTMPRQPVSLNAGVT